MTTIPWILNIYVLKYRNFKDDKDTTMLSVIGVNGKVVDRIHFSRETNSRIVKHFPLLRDFPRVLFFARVSKSCFTCESPFTLRARPAIGFSTMMRLDRDDDRGDSSLTALTIVIATCG